jgi:hypothetical protein
MEEPFSQTWFLRKDDDGTVFGPLSFDQLARWASTARVAPRDALSVDQQAWIKAPMLPDLGMDWLVELTSEHYYGPTTLGTIQEFIWLGEINEETFVTNACDGTRRRIREMPTLFQRNRQSAMGQVEQSQTGESNEPAVSGISLHLQERVRDLEQSLREERRALEEAERRYQQLEQRYKELADRVRVY